jgi:hypothetical protein
MTITYQLIIDTLCGNNKFLTDENITNNNFGEFSKIFNDDYYRYGIYNNILIKSSFWSSLLFLLDDKYLTYSPDDIVSNITQIKNDLYNYCSYHKLPRRMKDSLDGYTEDLFLLICKVFYINIINFDFVDNKIYCVYDGEYFNPYKNTIFLAKHNNDFEPIICKNTKMFNYINKKDIIINILSNDIQNYDDMKIFTLVDNIEQILTDENLLSNNDDIYLNEKYTEKQLNKMKKDEIIELLTNLNIVIPKGKITKKELINIYNKNI